MRQSSGLAVAAAAVVVIAGCSGNGAADGRARAGQARAQVASASRALARQFAASGLGPLYGSRNSTFVEGSYLSCPPARGTGLYYSTGFGAAPVREAEGRTAAYRHRVATTLIGSGWQLTPAGTPQHQRPFGYAMTKGGLTGGVFASLRRGGIIEVLVFIQSSCFDPGPAGTGLRNKTDLVPLPKGSAS